MSDTTTISVIETPLPNTDNQKTHTQNKPKKSKRGAHLKPYHWKPGQSGNLSGRPKGSEVLSDCLRKVARQRKGGKSHMELVAKALFLKAEAGNVEAAKLILERLEGKAPDSLQITGQLAHATLDINDIIAKVRGPEDARSIAGAIRAAITDSSGA